ncbi:MAG: iron ABC transporter permease [Gammaproteobacteria bacterium]
MLAALFVATAFGFYRMPIQAVARAVVGIGSAMDLTVVRDLRLARALECLLLGGALGLSGAIFQSMTRNPLASPDVLGINAGASVVAVWLVVTGNSIALLRPGAVAGALAVILLLGALGIRRHFSLQRLLLVGIAINAFCGALLAYLLTKRPPDGPRLEVEQWLFGSLAGASWSMVGGLALMLAILVPVSLLMGHQLNTLQLGEDVAVGLGVRTRRLQITLMAVGALLVALVVTAAGACRFRRIHRTSHRPSAQWCGRRGFAAARIAGGRAARANCRLHRQARARAGYRAAGRDCYDACR